MLMNSETANELELQAFLGVQQSITGKKWLARAFDERMSTALAQRFTLPEIVARCLSSRGCGLAEAEQFIEPRLRDLLPDPSRFQDMDKAAERAKAAILNHEKIAIFGDYDVDGGTSTALLCRFFRHLGVEPVIYIPDRLQEGYGPNSAALLKLKSNGVSLVLCVDCGTTAHEPLSVAHSAGLDVVVLDHHAAEPILPPAYAIVNPNRLDDENAAQFGILAAVGVTYLFVIALNRLLRREGFYNAQRPEPDLRMWLDLVALGTVCDVVKLTGLNRAFVAQGLKVMSQRQNAGLATLAAIAGANKELDTYAAGFLLGPRVNAGGRVGRADIGARLLSTDESSTALQLAQMLNQYNAERKLLESEVLAEADSMQMQLFEHDPVIVVANDKWHHGVIGIVASRLKDKYNRPAIVIACEGNIGKGSGRSVPGFDLGAAVIAARQAGILINGGGHKMAAGLTVARENISELHGFLKERLAANQAHSNAVAVLHLDGLVAASALTPEFIYKLNLLAPFGAGNPEPRFALAACKIVKSKVVGEKHLSLILQQGSTRVQAIAFRAMENNMGHILLEGIGQHFHFAGTIKAEEWNGNRRVQMQVFDAAAA